MRGSLYEFGICEGFRRILGKCPFSAAFHVEHHLAQLICESGIFYTRFNDMHRKTAYLNSGQKRPLRPRAVNELRLDIECAPTGAGRVSLVGPPHLPLHQRYRSRIVPLGLDSGVFQGSPNIS